MSSRRLLQEQLRMLRELREVMNAMKNISLMETNRLRRFIPAQKQVMESAEAMAEDFLGHYPQPLSPPAGLPTVYLLIGSERGFCGDFNTALRQALEQEPLVEGAPPPALVVMGRKLSARLGDDPRVVATLESPSVAEEVSPVLSRLVETLSGLRLQGEPFSPLSLVVLFHEAENHGSLVRRRRPLPSAGPERAPRGAPPLLTMAPEPFFAELVHHYLFAALHGWLYSSLLAEHDRRLRHLDGAIRRLDRQCGDVTKRAHALRQEEITEEIELILLSGEMTDRELDTAAG